MDLLWVAISYLLGSIPASYIVARAVKGIDIRRSGSGQVGGANVWAHVSFGAFLVAGLADVAKAIAAVGAAHWARSGGVRPLSTKRQRLYGALGH